MPSTINYQQFMKQMKEKENKFEYNPNNGYEPYWADGEWVLTTRELLPWETTTPVPLVCGEECHHLWRKIEHVCARKSDYDKHNGCTFKFLNYCTGKHGDNINPAFITFDTYCQFLNSQCKTKFYDRSRYTLVHVGKCQHLDVNFKPVFEKWQPLSRMEFYLSSYADNHSKVKRKTRRPMMTMWPG